MYTKEHARENGQMLALAKELLAEKGDGVVDTTARQHPDVYDQIAGHFPDVAGYRIHHKMAKAIRILRGEKVRWHGAPPGNQNAKKSEVKPVFSVRLSKKAIARLKGRALEKGISVADYIEMLSN